MRKRTSAWSIAALLLGLQNLHAAQPALPFSLEQLRIGLPEEGAPRAVVGPHAVTAVQIDGTSRLQVYRPRDLSSFPSRDTLSIVVWGNGACLADGSDFAGFLSTVASYGFLVVTSAIYATSCVSDSTKP